MKITAIKAQLKNPDRVSIFVDSKYSFSLTLDQLLSEKLNKDKEVDENDIRKYKKLSDEGKLKSKVLDWLMRRPHSVREYRDYMYRKKADKDLTEALLEEFKKKDYLNDENFTRWFVENRVRKNKSKREIEAELRSKGVSQVIVQKVATELALSNSEKESLTELVKKLQRRSKYQDKIKLKQYLTSKGFSYSDIKEIVD